MTESTLPSCATNLAELAPVEHQNAVLFVGDESKVDLATTIKLYITPTFLKISFIDTTPVSELDSPLNETAFLLIDASKTNDGLIDEFDCEKWFRFPVMSLI
ncbi:hypothetical protein ACI8B_210082 [Acinetobacter proteolyticus]|uniref:Uncharacterized protein n=1 Tax=Acinetobacter proteolyticus TaxID=1776741 RepID=A0A653K4R4_9GAMM|nr:hypothetical protein ACI8B_210082 [Acinetobacter proteolyticus]